MPFSKWSYPKEMKDLMVIQWYTFLGTIVVFPILCGIAFITMMICDFFISIALSCYDPKSSEAFEEARTVRLQHLPMLYSLLLAILIISLLLFTGKEMFKMYPKLKNHNRTIIKISDRREA